MPRIAALNNHHRVTVFWLLAAAVVLVHLAFVVFAALGSLLALRWPAVVWVHVPAAAWAVFVELSGRLCPLTPLENFLRERAGLEAYSGDFVAQYVFPLLYPDGLTRGAQIAIGSLLLVLNVGLYAWMLGGRRRARRRAARLD